MHFLLSFLVHLVAAFLTAYFLPGVMLDGWVTASILVVVLSLLTTFVRPILVALTLPIHILTLGLSVFLLNALFVLLASSFLPGFSVTGFGMALLFSLVMSLVASFLGLFIGKK